LCALLSRYDHLAFCQSLAKAGYAQKALLLRYNASREVCHLHTSASNCFGLHCSIVAGDARTASDIALAMPQACRDEYEYEEDFLFAHIIGMFALKRAGAEIGEQLRSFEAICEPKSVSNFRMLSAIHTKDSPLFQESLKNFIEERKETLRLYRKKPDFNRGTYAAHAPLSLVALALLRLAEQHDINCASARKLFPAASLKPTTEALPPLDSWKSAP
jgi:hypothetical protein